MKTRRFLLLLSVLFSLIYPAVVFGGNPFVTGVSAKASIFQDKPLTLAQILTGLQTQGKTPETKTLAARNKFIANRIRQRGVAFQLNEEREQDLRDAGASDELINVIWEKSGIKLKPIEDGEEIDLNNMSGVTRPDDNQITITSNIPGLKLVRYYIFLLTNASNSLFIGTEDDVKTSVRCGFGGGGTNCKETDLVTYKKLLRPFASYEEAQSALCRSITEIKEFPLGVGLKGRWQNSDNWYGLWNVSISDCPSPIGGKQSEAERKTVQSETNQNKNYSIIIGNPGQSYSGTLVLIQQGAILTGSLQMQFRTSQIKDGKIMPEGFSFRAMIESQGRSFEIFVKGTVTENRISGTMESQQGSVPFSGTRNP